MQQTKEVIFCNSLFFSVFVNKFIDAPLLVPPIIGIIICKVSNINIIMYSNKYAKKTLNRGGPKTEPCGTPKIAENHSLYELLTFFSCFLCDR